MPSPNAPELALVTIAPGACVRVSPHPSGLPLPALVLEAGDTLRVTLDEAAQLYNAGRVLHYVTGEAKPPKPKHLPGVTITLADGRVLDPSHITIGAQDALLRGAAVQHEAALYAEREAERRTLKVGVSYGMSDPLGPIPGVD